MAGEAGGPVALVTGASSGIGEAHSADEPEDVVRASFTGLDTGELVCAPGLEDARAIETMNEAQRALVSGGVRSELAAR